MAELSLLALAMHYFGQLGYEIERNIVLVGVSGIPHDFDLYLKKGDEVKLVYVKDWARSVGVNIVIKIDMTAEDLRIRHPVVVARCFSSHAYTYSNRHGITLLTHMDLSKRNGPLKI
ncbi:hypothetical protein MUP77_21120 [Candidatus Bathyarchaeota archaeon]|nr:hypothetical protein [Candidatus Bathyarchaeota archaeon]